MFMSAVIFANDLAKMTTFYSELLNPSTIVHDEDGNWTELTAGASQIWIHLIGAEWRMNSDTSGSVGIREENPIKLVLDVSVPASEVNTRVSGLGGSVIKRPWGTDYSDPEGNVFSVRFDSAS